MRGAASGVNGQHRERDHPDPHERVDDAEFPLQGEQTRGRCHGQNDDVHPQRD